MLGLGLGLGGLGVHGPSREAPPGKVPSPQSVPHHHYDGGGL